MNGVGVLAPPDLGQARVPVAALTQRAPHTPHTAGPGGWLVGRGVITEVSSRPARVRYYALPATVAVLATARSGFVPPSDPRPMANWSMAWQVNRGDLTVYCPREDVLIARLAAVADLVQLAKQLHLS